MASLQNRIALVTGASRGIGEAVARRLAKEGAHVICAARTVGALEALDDKIKEASGTATLVPLDLTEGDKIDQLGGLIAERFGKLDILVGNAGMLGDLTPLTHAESQMWEKVMALNVTANWRLIRSFDPLLRASDAGRAMFVTSGMAERITPYWGPYTTSKVALEALVKTYAAEIASTKVKANLINPGMVGTAMLKAAMPGLDMNAQIQPDAVTDIFVTLASPACKKNGAILHA